MWIKWRAGGCNSCSVNLYVFFNPSRIFLGDEREALVDELTEIARDGFGSQMTREDVENHVLKTEILYLVREKNNVVGFSSHNRLKINGRSVLYNNGIAIKRNAQRKGIYYEVNKEAMNLNKFDFVAMRTQNPVIYGATLKLVKQLYPDGYEIPEEIKEIGKTIAKDYLKMLRFDENTFIGRGTYGCSLYNTVPRYKDESINKFFDETLGLDYSAGDSVLLVGKL